ncbi:MAG: histidine kinase [Syntrophothermus sp.]
MKSNISTTISQEERNTLLGMLHDGLGQELVCLKMAAHRLVKEMDSSGENMQKVNDIMMMIENVMTSVRKISEEIRPRVLQEFGIIAAIQNEILQARKQSKLEISFMKQTPKMNFGNEHDLEIFRIFQDVMKMLIKVNCHGAVIIHLFREEMTGNIKIHANLSGKKKLISTAPAVLVLKLRAQEAGGSMTTHVTKGEFIIDMKFPLAAE